MASELHGHALKRKQAELIGPEHVRIPSGLVDGKSSMQPVVGSRVQRSVVPLASSLLANSASIIDAGLSQARRFRVGWAPNWMTACLARQATHDRGSCLFRMFIWLICMQ